MPIALKRVYDTSSNDDGVRILVDRLWPRGLSKQRAKIDRWLREAAPSTDLRRWYNHEPSKWAEFKRRYFVELRESEEVLLSVLEEATHSKVTLLFAAREGKLNNAVALKEYLLRLAKRRR